MESQPAIESTVLEKFYSDIQDSILDPVRVASLLRQEGVVSKSLLDEISAVNRFTLSERAASILHHVETAVKIDPKNFWALVNVLEQTGPPACIVAKRLRDAVELHALGKTLSHYY